jgi:hypothetical protein
MEDDNLKSEKPGLKPLGFDPADPRILDVFIDDAWAFINASSASLTFTQNVPLAKEYTAKPVVRLHMSHDLLIRLSNLLNSRATALIHLYGDHKPTLLALDQEVVNHTLANMNKVVDE